MAQTAAAPLAPHDQCKQGVTHLPRCVMCVAVEGADMLADLVEWVEGLQR
jgi:hypothetical protein